MKRLLFAVILLCMAGIGSVIVAWANSLPGANQPGSADDPLITKSYLDQRLNELLASIGDGGTGDGPDQGGQPPSGHDLVVVEMMPGEQLIGRAGTEFIVRTGQAVIVSNTTDGVPDLTAGVDLKAGTAVPNNHLLSIPRDDGRGIRTHENEQHKVFVMVRGSYIHIKADGTSVPH